MLPSLQSVKTMFTATVSERDGYLFNAHDVIDLHHTV